MPVWDLSVTTYSGNQASASGEDSQLQDATLSSDGTKLFVVGGSNHVLYQYTVGTAWDMSTVSYASKSFDFGGQDISPKGVAFRSNGLTMFMCGAANRSVFQYTLGTAWDASTISYASKFKNITAEANSPVAVEFSADGTKMYVIGTPDHTIRQYTLSTAWDVSTAVYASKAFDLSSQDTTPQGLRFDPTGTIMFVAGDANDTIFQYTLSTAWDISTASYASISFSVATQETIPVGLAFRTDTGGSMYVTGGSSDHIIEYTLGSLTHWWVGSVH